MIIGFSNLYPERDWNGSDKSKPIISKSPKPNLFSGHCIRVIGISLFVIAASVTAIWIGLAYLIGKRFDPL